MIKMAARIGGKFGIDPVEVLRDQGDSLINQIRVAALKVIEADEKAAEAASKK